ncbi:BcepNY3gp68 [Burkholderia phage BcepNY3]|uniref:BcepNY3gp68 n=1 Tax=Burkholderia phage BcepNY3 TaxID=2881397 RepID=A6N3H6_9CAUD|nr:tail protein [Burkholderia phage BcepNY3]ABR10603.1 BcepNY3gp68 [Burkholderia phage BcepNY3]
MKFEFDSIEELQGFLEFARNVSAIFRAAPTEPYPDRASWPDDIALVPDAHLTPEERAAAQHEAQVAATGALLSSGLSIAVQSAAPDSASVAQFGTSVKPPRKRRTKAEIEADKAEAANTPPDETKAPSDAQATAATSPLAGANPFDASTSNPPAATAALNEAPAGTTGTLSALGSDVRAEAQSAVDGLGADVDPQTYMQLRVAEMGGAFDAREHMKKCVEFIGALGKARYDEAFDLAGTSRSVATYTPADCAKHIAALEYLQLSSKGA